MGKIIEFPYERIRGAKPSSDPLMEELSALEKDLEELNALQMRVARNFGQAGSWIGVEILDE